MKEQHADKKIVDLFMFMGQSNMAGRGITTAEHPECAPNIIDGAGYEYRAVSSPDMLYKISEPFGVYENRKDGIDDGNMKTGSLVTDFVNAYYENTSIPVIAVSASKGGSKISQWQPDGNFLTDAISRLHAATIFLQTNDYTIRHKYMLWCQGESDGDIFKSAQSYCKDFQTMLDEMMKNGIEKCFLIRIGKYNGSGKQDYTEIRTAQNEITRINKNVIMVSTKFEEMKKRGLMKDDFHYYQKAYNEVGQEAGTNTALYVNKIENNK